MTSGSSLESNHFLISAGLIQEDADLSTFPFSLPIISHLDELRFHPRVTFIVGENGSGKSTLLEAIAIGMGFNAEGGSKNFRFSTMNSHSALSESLKLVKGYQRPKDGYFLRAESFYNVASEIERLDQDPGDSGPLVKDSYGGKSLHNQSHGESFMSLFEHRFGGNGLYILDEPEAALSPARQLQLLALLHQYAQNGSQFIIATHSPILMSYPDADIYLVEQGPLQKVDYEDTDHYRLMKYFMNNRQKMLNEILAAE